VGNFDNEELALATGMLVGHLTLRNVNVEVQTDENGDYKREFLVMLPSSPTSFGVTLQVQVVGVTFDG